MIDTVEAVAAAALHPWNAAFAPRPRSAAPRRLSPAQVDAYHEDGFLLVPDVLAPDRLAAVAAEIDPHERRVNDLLHRLGGRVEVAAADALTVTLHLSTFAPACRALAYDEVVADVVHDLVGPDARLYWDQAVYKLPGNPDVVPWHQDNGYAYVEPQDYLTLWVPLVDATLANGTVWVVPGGHRRGTLVHRKVECGQECLPESTDGAVAIEARAGSIIAFSSLTPHRTGPNDTAAARPAYILQYAPEGAEVLEGDPARDPVRRVPCADPGRQHPIVTAGRWTPPPPL